LIPIPACGLGGTQPSRSHGGFDLDWHHRSGQAKGPRGEKRVGPCGDNSALYTGSLPRFSIPSASPKQGILFFPLERPNKTPRHLPPKQERDDGCVFVVQALVFFLADTFWRLASQAPGMQPHHGFRYFARLFAECFASFDRSSFFAIGLVPRYSDLGGAHLPPSGCTNKQTYS